MLESGLQAAVSWDSLLCVYMVAMAISELYAKYLFFFLPSSFRLVYTVGHLWRGKAPPMRTLGGGAIAPRPPPAPPPLNLSYISGPCEAILGATG